MAKRKFKDGDIVVRTRNKWDGRKIRKGDVGTIVGYVRGLYGTSTNFYKVKYVRPLKSEWNGRVESGYIKCEYVSCLKKATGKYKDKYWLYKFGNF